MTIAAVNRREFLAALGIGAGSLTLSVTIGTRLATAQAPGPFEPSVYLSLAPDGVVSVIVHRSEMGQGVRTALPMIVADELEADWSRVRVLQAEGDARYGNQNTDGSRSVRTFFEPLRRAGATAREMLISAAAKKWRLPRSRLEAKHHAVRDKRSGKTIAYGELSVLARSVAVPPAGSIVLKPASEFRYIGKSKPIVDGEDIVVGAATFGADISVDGMLTAVIARPPAVGDEVGSVDDTAALAVRGVRKVVTLPVADLPSAFRPLGGVAVIAENTWAAIRGREALVISWKPGRHRGYESKAFRAELEATARKPGHVARDQGDVDAALAKAAVRVTADYYVPHLAQAPMEPPVAVAHVSGDRCRVWASVQTPQSTRREVASALKIKPENVTVNVTLLGGGFGRKSKPDFVAEAALLSRAAGAPVRLQWTRTDDLRHGFFHTVSAQRAEGGLDASGKVIAWKHRSTFPPIGATFAPTRKPGDAELGMGLTDLPLAIANIRVEGGEADAHVRIGWMRSVANIYHAFATGSFVDELAHAAKRDPRELWLELLAGGPRAMKTMGIAVPWNYGETSAAHHVDPSRLARVIERATDRAGWSVARAEGRHLGLSAHRSFASYVATVIELVVPPKGPPRALRVFTAIDAGQIVHRDRVVAQLEGAVIFGLSIALHGEISAVGGQVVQSNFHDYPVLRMSEAPRVIDVDIVASHGAPGGVGEPGVPPVAPAFANALFAATGKRYRALPIAPQLRG